MMNDEQGNGRLSLVVRTSSGVRNSSFIVHHFKEALMPLIADKDQQTIRQHFAAHLAGDVEIVLFTERESPIIVPRLQPCETCKETEALLAEVTALSDRLKLTVHELQEARDEAARYGIDRVPVFVLK